MRDIIQIGSRVFAREEKSHRKGESVTLLTAFAFLENYISLKTTVVTKTKDIFLSVIVVYEFHQVI